jgi:hypothetical protein
MMAPGSQCIPKCRVLERDRWGPSGVPDHSRNALENLRRFVDNHAFLRERLGRPPQPIVPFRFVGGL